MSFDVFVLDVDGVMTDGTFFYSEEGKLLKRFGPEDSDALKLLQPFLEIRFVTADSRGLGISKARITRDLGFPLDLVSSSERLLWMSNLAPLDKVAYMGDSFLDWPALASVGLSIVPSNGSEWARSVATFVTPSSGGAGAVAEACIFISGAMNLSVPEFIGPQGHGATTPR